MCDVRYRVPYYRQNTKNLLRRSYSKYFVIHRETITVVLGPSVASAQKYLPLVIPTVEPPLLLVQRALGEGAGRRASGEGGHLATASTGVVRSVQAGER